MTAPRTPRVDAEMPQRVHDLELTMERLIERVDNLVKAVDALSVTVKSQKTPLSIWLQAAGVSLTIVAGLFWLAYAPLQHRIEKLEDRVDALERRAAALEATDASSVRDRQDLRRELERLHDERRTK